MFCKVNSSTAVTPMLCITPDSETTWFKRKETAPKSHLYGLRALLLNSNSLTFLLMMLDLFWKALAELGNKRKVVQWTASHEG